MERHFTATTYILANQKVLLIYHPKYKKWLPPGGHLEPNEIPSEGAKREAKEETGLEIEFIGQENIWLNCWNASSFPRPYMCLLENIPPIGQVPEHQHLDFIYLARPLPGQTDANLLDPKHVKWFSLDEVRQLKTDEEMFGDTKQTISHLLNTASLFT